MYQCLEKRRSLELIVINEKGCEKTNNRLHYPYSCSILLFYIFLFYLHNKKDVDLYSHFHDFNKSYGTDRPFENLDISISAKESASSFEYIVFYTE